jgi:hypothetical protein
MNAERLSPALRTLVSDLQEQVATAPRAGSVYRRAVGGVEYVYAKVPVGGSRVDQFIGKPGDPAVEQQAAAFQQGARLAAERRRLVATLRREGMPVPDRTMGAVLDALAYAGLFEAGGVLVGTAAYLVSATVVGARLPAPTLMTGDLDLATASLAITADPPETFEAILRRADPTFEAVGQLRPKAPPSRFRNAEGYLVDLVTPTRTRDDENPVGLPELAAGAAPLQHLAWLIDGAVRALALTGAGVLVNVPQPARFAVHKLILAQRRDTATRLKRAKDLAQARALIEVLRELDPYALEDALAEAASLGERGWRTPLLRSLTELGIHDLPVP